MRQAHSGVEFPVRSVVLAVGVLLAGSRIWAADNVLLHAGAGPEDASRISFATLAEARQTLRRSDRFSQAMSRFDRQSRLKTEKQVTEKQFLDFAAGEARPWTEKERQAVTQAVDALRGKLAPFAISFPKTVLLIKTTGAEEGNAAYCRRNAIVLPARMLQRPVVSMERLLNHELFHILSAYDAKVQDALYAIIGFRRCPTIALPPAFRDRKITNPDAPTLEHLIDITWQEKPAQAVPVLYSKLPKFDAASDNSFFASMQFRLMLVENVGKSYRARLVDAEPVMLDPATVPSFHAKIGANTRYIIHPDEVLADNFVLLIQQSNRVKTPAILAALKRELQPSRKPSGSGCQR